MKYGDAVRKGFRFLYDPKRWLPLFVVDAAFFLVVAALFTSSIADFLSAVSSMTDALVLMQYSAAIAGAALSFVVWLAVRLWVTAAIVHQTYREKDFGKSWTVARNRYLSLIGVMVVVASVAGILSAIPFAGIIFSLLVGWAFFFVFQDVILSNKDSFLALNNSMKMFKSKPLQVIVSWLLVSLITVLIIGIFSIPVLAFVFGLVSQSLLMGFTDPNQVVAGALVSLQSNVLYFYASGLIFILGLALGTAFALKVQTELYLQIKKDLKLLVFKLLP